MALLCDRRNVFLQPIGRNQKASQEPLLFGRQPAVIFGPLHQRSCLLSKRLLSAGYSCLLTNLHWAWLQAGQAGCSFAAPTAGSFQALEGRPIQQNPLMASHALTNKIPLQYWRASLAEVSLLHPKVEGESKAIEIGEQGGSWQVVKAFPNLAQWVGSQFSASKSNMDGKALTIPYVLIPARLSHIASSGVKREVNDTFVGLTVLCIPCLLDRNGKLLPDADRSPWIPRDLLEPTLNDVALGQLKDYDGFIGSLPVKPMGFGDTLKTAAMVFEKVTGAVLPSLETAIGISSGGAKFEADGFELVEGWHGIAYEPAIPAVHLIRLYDHIMKVKPVVPLLESLRTIAAVQSRPPLQTERAEQVHKHTYGHIHRKNPLSPSQRESLAELTLTLPGGLLSVNGPPGTGKTTLLQSVVAQMWVDAALRKAKECPLVVVTSTNAKAVENVLDSFAKICPETGHQRWHPYEGGFGLFLASESRETIHPKCTSKSHPYSEFETPEGLAKATTYYLKCALSKFAKNSASVQWVVDELHGELKTLASRLKDMVAARYGVFATTGQGLNDGAATSCRQLIGRCQQVIDQENQAGQAADDAIADCNAQAKDRKTIFNAAWADIARVEKAWSVHIARTPFWLELLSFMPFVRNKKHAFDRAVLLNEPLTERLKHREDGVDRHWDALRTAAMEHKISALAEIEKSLVAAHEERALSIRRKQQAQKRQTEIFEVFARWQTAIANGYEHQLDVSLDALNDQIDVGLRAHMFALADWYWSGRWLLEVSERVKNSTKDTKGRDKLEAKYRRFAKLSPCMASNFHIAPAFFTAWQGEDIPLWNTIDLLIVDEAGQVSPDVGVPMFALAKRALVVGDVHQIEPVWNVGEGTDRANAAKTGLIGSMQAMRYQDIEQAGFTAAKGSLMMVANRTCQVQKYEEMRGLMLIEHRRCVPELVAFCNQLIYAGRLLPMRKAVPKKERILPAFGFLNADGKDKKVGGSRSNDSEAKAIVEWIKANRNRLEQHYPDDQQQPTPLWKLVGIVTPFKAQMRAVEKQLLKQCPDLMKKGTRMTVGTVHALQGAERKIVIFSPTYGKGHTGGVYFDQSPNMLNVAVSRAQDSFLVIGNLALFDAGQRNRPSGLLASHLFHGEGSAPLTNIFSDLIDSAP